MVFKPKFIPDVVIFPNDSKKTNWKIGYQLIFKTIFFPKLNNVEVAFYGPNMISIILIKNLELFNQKKSAPGFFA